MLRKRHGIGIILSQLRKATFALVLEGLTTFHQVNTSGNGVSDWVSGKKAVQTSVNGETSARMGRHTQCAEFKQCGMNWELSN